MITAQSIQQIINTNIVCHHIEVNGDGQHWFATIVADSFAGLTNIKRHQLIYTLLRQQIDSNELHALSLRTYTKEEWDKIDR